MKVKHLWNVQVRHRDYVATKNDERAGKRLYMATTTLLILAVQSGGYRPSIDVGISAARRFLNRNQRKYGLPNIEKIEYVGDIDENPPRKLRSKR